MSATESKVPAFPPVEREDAIHSLPPELWEKLCAWLTETLKSIETTVEHQQENREWVVECLAHPLQAITTRRSMNGVQIISVDVGLDGKQRRFEIAGPESIMLHRNAAGWPVKLEIGCEEEKYTMRFSGPPEPQKRQSGNAWGE